MNESDDFSVIDCEHVLTGSAGRVVMSNAVLKEFLALETRKQAQIMSRAKLWAEQVRLTREQFNGNEGRCGGDNDRMLVAIKTSKNLKVRIYGFVRHFRGLRTLVLVDIDSAKKQDKARPRILKRAKDRAVLIDKKCGECDEQ